MRFFNRDNLLSVAYLFAMAIASFWGGQLWFMATMMVGLAVLISATNYFGVKAKSYVMSAALLWVVYMFWAALQRSEPLFNAGGVVLAAAAFANCILQHLPRDSRIRKACNY